VRLLAELLIITFAVLLLYLLFQLYKRIFRYADRTVDDVASLLRMVKLDQLRELLDSEQEKLLRLNLPGSQFRKMQKKRVRRLLEYLTRMTHNAGIVWEWARYERKRSWVAGDKDREELTEDLIHTCIEVVGGIRAMQLQLHLWLVKNAVFPRMPELSLASLHRIETFDLLASYEQLRGIALALSAMVYGESHFEQLMQAL